jgi:hypothetical protein
MTLLMLVTGYGVSNSMLRQWEEYYMLKEWEQKRFEEDLILLMAGWL